MRILLTGANGQVGHELADSLAALGEVVATTRKPSHRHPAVDLDRPDELVDVVLALRPDWIVNAAAYTAVDAAEEDEALAHAVNAAAPGALATAAAALGAPLVHFSTDYVFDGEADRPWREADAPRPLSAYGRTKLAGERAIADAGARHFILRTSWVFGARGRNFALTMRDLAAAGRPLRVVADQHGSPTWCRSLAGLVADLVRAAEGRNDAWWAENGGVYHATAPDHTTWHAFARHVVGRAVSAEAADAIAPVPTSEWPTPARRPRWSVLDSSRLRTRLGLSLPPWREQVDGMLEELES